eukprot:scaffold1528_cov198-Pinguiococcus_pyrenoidosus.AAC.7
MVLILFFLKTHLKAREQLTKSTNRGALRPSSCISYNPRMLFSHQPFTPMISAEVNPRPRALHFASWRPMYGQTEHPRFSMPFLHPVTRLLSSPYPRNSQPSSAKTGSIAQRPKGSSESANTGVASAGPPP